MYHIQVEPLYIRNVDGAELSETNLIEKKSKGFVKGFRVSDDKKIYKSD